ncbi:hypothetical protein N7504_003974 [Penicillium tannophilum]|nr:hypothetical protein N7504_003974 [Penicillium tannophilum]
MGLDSISLATQILCFSIVPPLIALRAFAKHKLHLPLGVDDASCYAALILFMGHCISIIFYTYSGGTISHGVYTTRDREIKYKIFYIATMFYVPMVLFVKTSLIYIMIRLWSPYRGKVIALYSFLAFIVSYYTVILFIKIFICNPIRLFWDVNRHDGTCLNRSAIIVTDSSISVITDLAILIFPIVLASTLHVPLSRKLYVIAILGAGSIAVAFSIYRLVLAVSERNSSDEIDVFMKVLLSDNAEGGLGLVCACIPSINKLLRQHKHSEETTEEERERIAK